MVYMLLGAFVVALVVSLVLCGIALKLFPWFCSGERKPGNFRPDQSTGNFEVDLKHKGAKIRRVRPSMELPLVGGPVMVLAVIAACLVAGVLLGLSPKQWTLLGILLAATAGFAIVGFVDDWRKVYRGSGISELQKLIGVVLVSLGAAIAFNRLVATGRLSARFAYPPYSQVPLLGSVLQHTHFAWIVFFLVMTVTVSSSTSLAVDFADGMDGLCGGLLFSAALALGVILLLPGDNDGVYWPLVLAALAIAGATFGYLPFNWPSSWNGKNSMVKRRARLIMGDTGSLALGGLLALVAVISRLEYLLIIIGGIFLLEGVSALTQGRILVKFFRRFLFLERFNSSRGFQHTEFPLPFLATPMHHHFDLLGWDRRRLVYSAWMFGAVLAVLGVASVDAPLTWERYLARAVGLIVIFAIWQSGPFTRYFFIGLERRRGASEQEPRYLALYDGYPFKLFGRRLYRRIYLTHVAEDSLSTPVEGLSLWQRMSVFDARALLGYYCYRAGELQDAQKVWERIPPPNLKVRPEIGAMLAEITHRLALDEAGAEEIAATPAFIQRGSASATNGAPANGALAPYTPAHDDPSASQWRMAIPSNASGLPQPPRLEPLESLEPMESAAPETAELVERVTLPDPTRFWNAATWNAAMTMEGGAGTAGELSLRMDAREQHPRSERTMPLADGEPTSAGEARPEIGKNGDDGDDTTPSPAIRLRQ